MLPSKRWYAASVVLAGILGSACSGGGGDGSGVIANVPEQSGSMTVDMTGIWEVAESRIVEINFEPPGPLQWDGAPIELSADGVLTIEGESYLRADIEAELGFPLDYYVNQSDGRILLLGYRASDPSGSGLFVEEGFAGGAIGHDRIEMENCRQTNATPDGSVWMMRVRFALLRRTVASARHSIDGDPADAPDARQVDAFGFYVPPEPAGEEPVRFRSLRMEPF